MQPQYVARHPSCGFEVDASVSQPAGLKTKPYIFHRFSPSFPHSYPQGSCISFSGWALQFRGVAPRTLCRRLRCLRASLQLWPWALLPLLARVHKKHLMMLFLLSNPSLLSRFLPNTKRPIGRATKPVLTNTNSRDIFSVSSVTGGKPC